MKNMQNVIEDFKKETIRMIELMMAKTGGMSPVAIILVKGMKSAEEKGKSGAVVCPIPPEHFEDSDSKKNLAKVILPKVFEELESRGLELICFSWSSEAWIRSKHKDDESPNDDWRDLPKREALITTFEYADGSDLTVNYMHREGKIVNEEGNLIDCIRLEKDPTFDEMGDKNKVPTNEGTLSNVFRNYLKNKL